jgi:hypothetical protein
MHVNDGSSSGSVTPDHSDTLKRVCDELIAGEIERARQVVATEYAHALYPEPSRRITLRDAFLVFSRDGFLDRYSGQRLVFPPVIRIISKRLPAEFPFHPNWKFSACHRAYWDLMPTVDHVVPVARGGKDDESNWVTASMLSNAKKANWTLEEMKWQLRSTGSLRDWDGLLGCFTRLIDVDKSLLEDSSIRRWYRAMHP